MVGEDCFSWELIKKRVKDRQGEANIFLFWNDSRERAGLGMIRAMGFLSRLSSKLYSYVLYNYNIIDCTF